MIMLRWAIIFFLIALAAGILGFSNAAAVTVGIAKFLFLLVILKIVFFVFIVLFIGSLFAGRG